MKRFISVSGGVESTAMCVLYGADATGIWADTGAEHKQMYDRINEIEDRIKQIHPRFELIRIKPKVKVFDKICETLVDAILTWRFMPSQQRRYCTERFKIIPIDDFLKQQEDCELLIGLNADEEDKRVGNLMKAKNVTYRYPLIEDSLTRDDCEMILFANNLHPDFPVYMSRGGCYMCFYKTKKEYKAMALFDPEEFQKVVDLELGYQDKRKKFYAILPKVGPMSNIRAEIDGEVALWGDEEVRRMYSKIPAHKVCGPFCHR